MLSIFYTRRGPSLPVFAQTITKPLLTHHFTEVAARIAGLYCAQILATGFSGLIAAGVFAGLDGVRGLAGWRWYEPLHLMAGRKV